MAGSPSTAGGAFDTHNVRYLPRDDSELPTFHRKATHTRAASESGADEMGLLGGVNGRSSSYGERKIHSRPRARTSGRWDPMQRWGTRRTVAFAVVAAFVLGYYFQVLVFFLHVRLGYTAAILPTTEVSLSDKFTRALLQHTRRIIFVSRKTNWDFVGLIASPHSVLFAHEDVVIPKPLDETLSVVRHTGVDSYLNLHNKTVTIMTHVHNSGPQYHFFKQDDEAVMFWPHYYQCMKQCKNLGSCYAGDMHVNIADATNANSYVFATGGSYFLGNELLKCLVENPVFVRLDGLDYGEDKTVGKMIHYNKCDVQYVSCKWFNNKEIYSPLAVVKMTKGTTERFIHEDTVLLGEEEQAELARANGLEGAVAKGDDGGIGKLP